jgi:hypothetical protein
MERVLVKNSDTMHVKPTGMEYTVYSEQKITEEDY